MALSEELQIYKATFRMLGMVVEKVKSFPTFLSLYGWREDITSIMLVIMINDDIDDGRLDSFPNLYLAVTTDRSRWRQPGLSPVVVRLQRS